MYLSSQCFQIWCVIRHMEAEEDANNISGKLLLPGQSSEIWMWSLITAVQRDFLHFKPVTLIGVTLNVPQVLFTRLLDILTANVAVVM